MTPTQADGPEPRLALPGATIPGLAAYGTLFQVLSDLGPPEAYVTIEGAGDISGPASQMGEAETTSHSTGAPLRSYIPTLADLGDMTFQCFWNPTSPTQAPTSPYGLEALFWARTTTKFRLVTPDVSHRTRTFYGYVKSLSEAYPVQGIMTRDVAVRIQTPLVDTTSPITLTPATAGPALAGGVGTPITLKAGGSVAPWRAAPDVGWITVTSPTVPTVGDGSIAYTVAAGTPGVPRTGHIFVSGLELVFTVNQLGA
jgi:hypothetical protein